MKTLANCTPKEFAVQTLKIADRVKKYYGGIERIKEKFSGNKNTDSENIFEILKYICNDNIEETMSLCGELCFMDGEKFANLDPLNDDEDGIEALVTIFNSKRVISFFTTALGLKKLIDRL
ncbi:MAG: hypothetical protein K2J36_02340 [Ruminococcus sp.]|nr:hypothetical protein [Ruminococcus sp.]MDE6796839.1 hypothetical protein [Ruminococcus sp.]